jgi:DNA-directed RNA polymerase specialized sigma24 family protein
VHAKQHRDGRAALDAGAPSPSRPFSPCIDPDERRAREPLDRAARDEHDGELVFRTVAGEVAAFAELYRCYEGTVRAIARSYVRDAETAADLVQDVFAQALERLHTLRRPDRFRAWLLAIARHAAIDHRRGGPSPFLRLDDVTVPEEPGPGPVEIAKRRETARQQRH